MSNEQNLSATQVLLQRLRRLLADLTNPTRGDEARAHEARGDIVGGRVIVRAAKPKRLPDLPPIPDLPPVPPIPAMPPIPSWAKVQSSMNPNHIVIKVGGKVVYVGETGAVDVRQGGLPGGSVHLSSSSVVIVNGQVVSSTSTGGTNVEIQGDVKGSVTCDGSVTARDVTGFVKAGGSVTCGNVQGDAKAGGNVKCGNVGGNVKADGSVKAGDVSGFAMAGGSVHVANARVR